MKVAIRKTSEMKFIELREEKSIEEVILSALERFNGVYMDAARYLNIDGSTLSRWIEKLSLLQEVDRIRLANNRAPSLNSELVIRDESRIAMCVEDKCRECEITFLEMFKAVFIGVVSDANGMYAIVSEPPHGKLARQRKHYFLLNRSKIETLIRPSDEVH